MYECTAANVQQPEAIKRKKAKIITIDVETKLCSRQYVQLVRRSVLEKYIAFYRTFMKVCGKGKNVLVRIGEGHQARWLKTTTYSSIKQNIGKSVPVRRKSPHGCVKKCKVEWVPQG